MCLSRAPSQFRREALVFAGLLGHCLGTDVPLTQGWGVLVLKEKHQLILSARNKNDLG